MTGNENGGAFLTDKRSRFLAGEDVFEGNKTAKQTRYNHRRAIRKHSKAAVYDFQHLFNFLDQEELEHEDAFGEGHEPTSEDPISRQRHDHGFSGNILDEFLDSDGNPRDPDAELNPDAEHQYEKILNELGGSDMATPETQEALTDAVAFLCRAAEAGELKIPEVLERGFERYHEDRAERRPNESEKIVKVIERPYGRIHNRARTRDREDKRLSSIEKKVMQIELRGE
jgi:hypothetical protein